LFFSGAAGRIEWAWTPPAAPLKNKIGFGGVWIYPQATPGGVKKRVSGRLGVGCSQIEMRRQKPRRRGIESSGFFWEASPGSIND